MLRNHDHTTSTNINNIIPLQGDIMRDEHYDPLDNLYPQD